MTGNLYIVGFMGVGKTYVGTRLAQALNRPFLDTDDEFARLHDQMTTAEYIRTFGIEQFRPEEERTLLQLATSVHRSVVSTGGGLPTYGKNMQILKESGFTVHVSVPLQIIQTRMTPQQLLQRPLWSQNTPEQLQNLFDSRLPIYNSAHLTVDGTLPVQKIIEIITETMQKHSQP